MNDPKLIGQLWSIIKNKLKPELGHKTESKANFEKICRPELRSEEKIKCAKFQKIWPYESTKVGVGFAGTGVSKFQRFGYQRQKEEVLRGLWSRNLPLKARKKQIRVKGNAGRIFT